MNKTLVSTKSHCYNGHKSEAWEGRTLKQQGAFRRLLGFIRPYRLLFGARIALTVLNAVMGVVSSWGGAVLVRAAVERSASLLWQGTAILAASLAVEAASTILSAMLMSRVSFRSMADVRELVFSHLQRLPERFFSLHHSGDAVSRMTNDLSSVQRFVSTRLTVYAYYPVRFLAAFCFMAAISWELLLACCIVIPLAIYVPQLVSKRIEARAKGLSEDLSGVNAAISDALAGVDVVKSFGMTEILSGKFENGNRRALDNSIALARLRLLMGIVYRVARDLPTIVCIVFGVFLAFQGRLRIDELTFFMMSIDYLAQPVANLPMMLEAWKRTKGSADRVFELLDEPMEKNGPETEPAPCAAPVEADGVTFTYGAEPVLRGLTFQAEPGGVTALVGASGGGKSTVLQLLCGFYTEYGGSLRILGRELRDWDLLCLRRHVAYVTQDAFLFPGSVYENIAMGRKGATREDVERAAKQANAHDFILQLPQGYDTQVGERGVRLSGGQRQRITIARAILKDAPLLLLDEPTSALDVHAEALVQEAIESMSAGRTVLVVAHRMSTIKNAGRVIVLDRGAAADCGTHGELMERSALYRALYQKEMKLLRGEAEE